VRPGVLLLVSLVGGRPILTLVMGKAFGAGAGVMNWQVAAAAIGVLALPLEPMLVSMRAAGAALPCAWWSCALSERPWPADHAFGLNGAGAALVASALAMAIGMYFMARAGSGPTRCGGRPSAAPTKTAPKDYPMITPTASERTVRFADFPTLTETLDFAATGETGVNLYSLRGELVEALPYAKLREDALVLAPRLLATGAKPGDSVALLAETDGDFVRAFFACQYAGLLPAPLSLPTPLGGRPAYIEQIARC
jgi:hypothetical protein